MRLFDNTHYLKALASDDVWVAIGWSSDVIPVAKRMSNMRVIAPKSGTSLWADLWVGNQPFSTYNLIEKVARFNM